MNGFPKLSTEEDLYESRNTVNKRKHAHSGEEQMKVRVDRYREEKDPCPSEENMETAL